VFLQHNLQKYVACSRFLLRPRKKTRSNKRFLSASFRSFRYPKCGLLCYQSIRSVVVCTTLAISRANGRSSPLRSKANRSAYVITGEKKFGYHLAESCGVAIARKMLSWIAAWFSLIQIPSSRGNGFKRPWTCGKTTYFLYLG
jgi:hypothetical protein